MEQESLNDNISRLIQPFDYTDPSIGCVTPLVCIQDAPVVVRGELTLLCGPKKTFKSNVCQCLAAALLGGDAEQCIGFDLQKTEQKHKVVIIDTEQSRPDFRRKCLNILSRAGLPDNQRDECLYTFAWRGEDPSAMIEALPIVIDRIRPDVVIIDGIADLVYDINNVAESRALSGMLLQLAETKNCGIVTVIHLNPNNSKERGHIGTWLSNKAYGYIALSRKRGEVVVSSEGGCRGKAFREFSIVYDESIHGVNTAERMLSNALKGEAAPAPKHISTSPPKCKTAEPNGKSIPPKQLANMIPGIIAGSGKKSLYSMSIVEVLTKQYEVKNPTSARRAIQYALDSNLIKQSRKRGPYSLPDPQLTLDE